MGCFLGNRICKRRGGFWHRIGMREASEHCKFSVAHLAGAVGSWVEREYVARVTVGNILQYKRDEYSIPNMSCVPLCVCM